MATSLYLSGEYLARHPNWHVEDSAWKAAGVVRMMERNRLNPRTVIEIGCGAGEVLAQLQHHLPADCRFRGYEISPQAFSMCGQRANARLQFSQEDALAAATPAADLALALDVVEHVDNYPEFLRSLRRKARHSILHIPLDLSVLSLLTGLPQRVRKTAGHLHYFTRALALEAVQEAGFAIVDAQFTRPSIERPNASLLGRLARLPRLALATIDEGLAATTLGGFSLLVLARNEEEACI